jgi:hypothetical protein
MTTTDEIRLVLEAKAHALVARSAASLDGLIHSDFVYINAGARTFDKAGYIKAYCTSGNVIFIQQCFSNITVKLIEHFAITTLSIEDELQIDGHAVSGRYLSMCFFTRTSGRWLWAAGQTTVAKLA